MIEGDSGRVTFLAPMAGSVTDLKAEQGSSSPQVRHGHHHRRRHPVRDRPVPAHTRRYGRIRVGGSADMELPTRTRMSATVSDVSVQTSEGVAVTTVDLEVPRLTSESLSSLNQPG